MPSLLKAIPESWGPKFGGNCGAVTRTRTGPGEISFTAPSHMALVMFTPQPNREVSLNSDVRSSFLAPAGAVEIVPEGSDLFARWVTSKENLLVALAPDRLERLAGLEFQRNEVIFQPAKAGHVDARAYMLASLIREEFHRADRPDDLYMDSLITVFATYLLRNYTPLGDCRTPTPRGGLPGHVWKRVDEYIRSSLSEKLSVEMLAGVAGLSPSHFLRAFRETTGKSPHQYVMVVRLEKAEEIILSTRMPLQQAARITGFSSHSHLTATMQRHWSVSPSALRQARHTS